MDLLRKTVSQVAAILVLANLLALATERLGWGGTGWRVVAILLIALGVFSLRLFQEITTEALRQTPTTTESDVEPSGR